MPDELREPSVYVVIEVDRHADPDAYVFADADSAIGWAKQQARERDLDGEPNEELTDLMRNDGWLYYGCYSGEGDYLRVVRREVQTHA